MQHYSLHGRRAVVCGSTQGIGKAIAFEFAALGASVTLLARNEEAMRLLCDQLPREQAQRHDVLVADFSDWKNVRRVSWEYAEEFGPVHLLVNNTGGPAAGPAFEGTPEQFTDAFSRHLLCNQVLVQAFAGGMRDERYGRIINIISTSVIQPIRNLGVSNTIRGAVANWARTLAAELGPFGITVNNILPGYTDTERLRSLFRGRAERNASSPEEEREKAERETPLRRLAEPREIATVAAFLASPAASYVNGVNLPVDGGRVAVQ